MTKNTHAENVHVCAHCGQIIEDEDDIRIVDGEEWCDDCTCAHAEYCEHCGSYTTNGVHDVVVGQYYGGRNSYEQWCEECADRDARECAHCGELFSEDCDEFSAWQVYGNGESWLCDDCRCDHYYRCDECGDLVSEDEVVYSERHDSYYCPDCVPEESDNLLSYRHTHADIFYQDDGQPVDYWNMTPELNKLLYFGVELETDHNDSAAGLADDIADNLGEWSLQCKEDGSLGPNGVEIVSQPMTPLCHLNSNVWDRVTDIVRDHGGISHDSGRCGLHIHISKAFFGDDADDAAYRIDRLVLKFRSQMVKFSRRVDTRDGMYYCPLSEEDVYAACPDRHARKLLFERKKDRTRYVAVNHCNDATTEIRLWRGTLNMETLRATIEFTAAVAILCKFMADDALETLTWGRFKTIALAALKENGIPSDDLASYLDRRGL